MKKLSILLFCAIFYISAFAVPARPGIRTYKQPDGSKIQVTVHGDETFHYTTDLEGNTLTRNAEGYWVKADKQLTHKDIRRARAASLRQHKAAPRRITTDNNLVTKGLVILVQFSDLKFQSGNTKDAFNDLLNGDNYTYNGATGSVKKYYSDQSNGNFVPTFEIYGPVTLDKSYAYYGANDNQGNDKYTGKMVAEACQKAYDQFEINLADFDADGDGYVDFIDILYAGYGEADYSNPEDEEDYGEDYIWPCEWSLSDSDYRKILTLGSKKIDLFSCHQELDGQTHERAGIGTPCHEFGHVFGLPDFYDTTYENPTLGDWDVMDGGAYLNNGNTPPGFSGYERMFAGWADAEVLNESGNITLPELQSTQKIYVISSTGNHNLSGSNPNPKTFYILENRQQTGWDKYIPGHGMLIWKIQYNASSWADNTVNNAKVANQGVALVPADGTVKYYKAKDGTVYTYGDDGDTYPGKSKVTSQKIESYTISNIAESNGSISFTFTGGGTTPGEIGNGAFKKVTSSLSDWSGTYLIVYEEDENQGLIFDGSLSKLDASSNTQEVAIADYSIDADDRYAFIIEKNGSSYAIKNKAGSYIGWEKEKNGMSEAQTPFALTITMGEEGVEIASQNDAHLRYNKTDGQERFRFYQSSTYSRQQPLQLYRKDGSGTAVDNITNTDIVVVATDQLQISGLRQDAQVCIYNIAGQLVANTRIADNSVTFDLEEGIYLVRIANGAETVTRKVIVR